jgi:hypothetical protein
VAKRVFFSFHYQDVTECRANVVRNHWMTKRDREEAGYFDASVWLIFDSLKNPILCFQRLTGTASV